jgi:hypothetical protein
MDQQNQQNRPQQQQQANQIATRLEGLKNRLTDDQKRQLGAELDEITNQVRQLGSSGQPQTSQARG